MKTKTLPEIQKELADKVLLYRSLERVAYSDRFERVFSSIEDKDKKILTEHLLEGNKNLVDQLLSSHLKRIKPYEEKSVKELRETARRLGIQNYSLYNKELLIVSIIGRSNEKAITY